MAPEDAKPEDLIKASDSCTDCTHPHGSQISMWPGAAVWTTDTNMASRGIAGHSGPLRGFNPESELFLISGFCCCPPVVRWLVPDLSLCLLNLQAIVHHPAGPTMAASRPQTSLSLAPALVSPVLPLSMVHKSLIFCLSHLSLRICSLWQCWPPPQLLRLILFNAWPGSQDANTD